MKVNELSIDYGASASTQHKNVAFFTCSFSGGSQG